MDKIHKSVNSFARRLYALAMMFILIMVAVPAMAEDKTVTFAYGSGNGDVDISTLSSSSNSTTSSIDKVIELTVNSGTSGKVSNGDERGLKFQPTTSFTLKGNSAMIKKVVVTLNDKNKYFDPSVGKVSNSNNPAQQTWSPDGSTGVSELTFTNNNGSNLYVQTIVVIYEKVKSKTILDASQMTKSTETGTTWDFSNNTSAQWKDTWEDLQSATDWTIKEANDATEARTNFSEETANTEFNLPLIKGLQFSPILTYSPCLDYKNEQLWLAAGTKITIPGVKKGVSIVFNTAQKMIAEKNASEKTTNTFQSTNDGDVVFTVPSTGAWIKSISVKLIQRNINIAKLAYKDATTAADGNLDRTVRGIVMKVSGPTAKLSEDKSRIVLNKGDKITFSIDDKAEKKGNITQLEVTFDEMISGNDNAKNALPTPTNSDWVNKRSIINNREIFYVKSSVRKLTFEIVGDYFFHISNFKFTFDSEVSDVKATPTITLKSDDVNVWANSKMEAGNIVTTTPKNLAGVTYTGSNGLAVEGGDVIDATNAKAGKQGTITATFNVPSESKNYFTGSTSTMNVNVINSKVWVFRRPEGATDNTGIAHGQDFGADNTRWSQANGLKEWKDKNPDHDVNVTDCYIYKPSTTESDQWIQLPLGSSTMANTSGLYFPADDDEIYVSKDKYLRIKDNTVIRIPDLPAGANVIVTAKTASAFASRGFEMEDQANLTLINDEHETSATEQYFMMKVVKEGEVLMQTDGDMFIYKIDVNTKKVPTINITQNGTLVGTNGDGAVSAINLDAEKPSQTAKVEVTVKDGSTNVWSRAKEVNVSTNNSNVATFNKENYVVSPGTYGGSATLVAKFTPKDDDDTYTVGYAFADINVADTRVFRIGENSFTDGTFGNDDTYKEGQDVYLKANTKITSVPGITLTLGGWTGDTDKARNHEKGYDRWDSPHKEAYVTTQDGFDYAIGASENAADEEGRQYDNRQKDNTNNLQEWFPSANGPDSDGGGYSDPKHGDPSEATQVSIPGNPYFMPARGGFLKFEPRVDGELTYYLLQNGAEGQKTVKDEDGVEHKVLDPTTLHLRSYYLADETGRVYFWKDEASKNDVGYMSAVPQTTGDLDHWFGKSSIRDNFNLEKESQVDNRPIYQKQYWWMKSQIETKNNRTASSDYQGIHLYRGGYTTLGKSQTRYSVHVKAGKTYYVFTSLTKIGFYGFRFIPDSKYTITKNNGTETVTSSNEETVALPSETNTTYTAPAVDASKDHKVSLAQKQVTLGAWNGVCLPFSMSDAQTKEMFGAHCEIMDFDHVTSSTICFKKHFYQYIVAGRPYLIYVDEQDFNNQNAGTTVNVNAPAGYVDFSNAEALKAPTDVEDANSDYVFKGTYHKLNPLEENAYFPYFNSKSGKTTIYQNKSGKTTLRGYRAYIGSKDGTLPAKSFVFSFDGIDDIVTGIDAATTDIADPTTSGDVYSISGVKVSTNGLNSLPAGVYIMNGRKYMVK